MALLLYCFLHSQFSKNRSHILLRIFLSNTPSLFSSFLFIFHVSEGYMSYHIFYDIILVDRNIKREILAIYT